MGTRGFGDLKRKIRRIDRNLESNVDQAVREGSERTADEIRAQVQNGNQVWTGNMLSSIYTRRDEFAAGATSYRVVVDVPYAAFVEFGTGARQDPKTPLKFRFDSPDFSDNLVGRMVSWVMTKPAFFGPRTVGMGVAIAQSIAEKGTHAHPYLRPAWRTAKPLLIRDVENAVERTIRRA